MTDQGSSTTGPFEQGPFINAAFLCEHLLRDQDNLASAIRITEVLDHEVVGEEAPQTMEPFYAELSLFLSFTCGDARGVMPLEIWFESPIEFHPIPFRESVEFKGDEDGSVVVNPQLRLSIETPGLHWFNVNLEGHRVTRIPLRVSYTTVRPVGTNDAY